MKIKDGRDDFVQFNLKVCGKTIEVRGSGQGGDPPFIKVKNNIV